MIVGYLGTLGVQGILPYHPSGKVINSFTVSTVLLRLTKLQYLLWAEMTNELRSNKLRLKIFQIFRFFFLCVKIPIWQTGGKLFYCSQRFCVFL